MLVYVLLFAFHRKKYDHLEKRDFWHIYNNRNNHLGIPI
jgi:hypothetical protein